MCCLNNKIPFCLINDEPYELYKFKEISCKPGTKEWSTEYKVYFFKESNNFMIIPRKNLSATLINNLDNSIIKCNIFFFSPQTNEYSIIYINDYKLVNYSNFSEHNQCYNIITKLNEFIKYRMNINYIDENKELIIPKNEITFSFTSTYIIHQVYFFTKKS